MTNGKIIGKRSAISAPIGKRRGSVMAFPQVKRPKPKNFVLTGRDVHIIMMVHEYGGVVIDVIWRRYFPNQTQGSRAKCYRRVAALLEAGFLVGVRLPSVSGQGSGKTFFSITARARQVIAEQRGPAPAEI